MGCGHFYVGNGPQEKPNQIGSDQIIIFANTVLERRTVRVDMCLPSTYPCGRAFIGTVYTVM